MLAFSAANTSAAANISCFYVSTCCIFSCSFCSSVTYSAALSLLFIAVDLFSFTLSFLVVNSYFNAVFASAFVASNSSIFSFSATIICSARTFLAIRSSFFFCFSAPAASTSAILSCFSCSLSSIVISFSLILIY